MTDTTAEFEACFARANALAGAGELDAAVGEYRAAVAIDPASAAARAGLGTVLLGAGRSTEAEAEFRAAWTAGLPAAAAGLALCVRARGAIEEARAVLEAAIAAGVDDPLCRELLAELPPAAGWLGPDLEAIDLRFTYGEELMTLACRGCGRRFEQALPSAMCDLPVACPGCGARGRLDPETTIRLVTRLQPALPADQADALDRALVGVVGTWHSDPALAPLLAVGDVNIGACAEHELMAIVLDAALAAVPGEG
ncbi:MAG: tetratricopeptide repeat protein [Candidatus Binatia bacterium]